MFSLGPWIMLEANRHLLFQYYSVDWILRHNDSPPTYTTHFEYIWEGNHEYMDYLYGQLKHAFLNAIINPPYPRGYDHSHTGKSIAYTKIDFMVRLITHKLCALSNLFYEKIEILAPRDTSTYGNLTSMSTAAGVPSDSTSSSASCTYSSFMDLYKVGLLLHHAYFMFNTHFRKQLLTCWRS